MYFSNDQLKLQELKKFYKYRHGKLPVYLLNWTVILNYNIYSHNTDKVINIQDTTLPNNALNTICLTLIILQN